MIRGDDWLRVRRDRPCPICGRPDWCLVAKDGSAAICPRTPDGAIKRVNEAGHLHRLKDDPARVAYSVRRRSRQWAAAQTTRPDMANLAARSQTNVKNQRLEDHASVLGVSPRSLQRLGIGWSCSHSAWTFPMTDTEGRVRGVRLRAPNGRKWAVKGGREGLFIPAGVALNGRALICEGPTDAAALMDIGFNVVGRPSCTGGIRLLVDLVRRHKPQEVVIVADHDPPGQRGARELGATLRCYASAVRIIAPPVGIKDARAWVQAGATASDVQQAIYRATPLSLAVRLDGEYRHAN